MTKEDLKFLFDNDKAAFGKPNVRRVIASDDPSFPIKPETSSYRHHTGSPEAKRPEMTQMSTESDDRSELAQKADTSLTEAVEHLEVDQRVENALKVLVEELDKKSLDYHTKHPIPGDKPPMLQEPDWAKEANDTISGKKYSRKQVSNRIPIARVGNAPKEEESPFITDIRIKVKALAAGMSVGEIKSADSALDGVFVQQKVDSERSFR